MKVNIGKVKKDGTQKVEVKIDPWDTWNCDVTMMRIIHPLFKQLKDIKNSYSLIHKDDVPECLHKYYKETDNQDGIWCSEAYDWVLDEIIWATQPDWDEKYEYDLPLKDIEENYKRRNKAMKLFGKYFFTFWD